MPKLTIFYPPSSEFRQLARDFFGGREVVEDYGAVESSNLIDLDEGLASSKSDDASYGIIYTHERLEVFPSPPLSDDILSSFLVDLLLSREIKKAIAENTRYQAMKVFHSYDHSSLTGRLNQLEKTWADGNDAIWKEADVDFIFPAIKAGEITIFQYKAETALKETSQIIEAEPEANSEDQEKTSAKSKTKDVDTESVKQEQGGTDTILEEAIKKSTKSKKKKKKGKKKEVDLRLETYPAQSKTEESDIMEAPKLKQTSAGTAVKEAIMVSTKQDNKGQESEAEPETSQGECKTLSKQSQSMGNEISNPDQADTHIVVEEADATFPKKRKRKAKKHVAKSSSLQDNVADNKLNAQAEFSVISQTSLDSDIKKGSVDEAESRKIQPHPTGLDQAIIAHERDKFLIAPQTVLSANRTKANDISSSATNITTFSQGLVTEKCCDTTTATASDKPADNITLLTQANRKVRNNRWKKPKKPKKPKSSEEVDAPESEVENHIRVPGESQATVSKAGKAPQAPYYNDSLQDRKSLLEIKGEKNASTKGYEQTRDVRMEDKLVTPWSSLTTTLPVRTHSDVSVFTFNAFKNVGAVTELSKSFIPAVSAGMQGKPVLTEPYSQYNRSPPLSNVPVAELPGQSHHAGFGHPSLETTVGTDHKQASLQEDAVIESNLAWADLTLPNKALSHQRFTSLQDVTSRFKEHGTVTSEAETPAQLTAVRDSRILSLQFGEAPIGYGLSLPLASTREPRFHHPDAHLSEEFARLSTTDSSSSLGQSSIHHRPYSADESPEYYTLSPSFVTTMPKTKPDELAAFSHENDHVDPTRATPVGCQRNPIFQNRASRSFSVPCPPTSNVMTSTPKQALGDYSRDEILDQDYEGHAHSHPAVTQGQSPGHSSQPDQNEVISSPFICVCCKVMRYPTSEEPVYFCPFCGPLTNVRYCSRACILADAFEHAGHCVNYAASQSAVIISPPSHYIYDKDAISSLQSWDVQTNQELIRQKIFSMYCFSGPFPEVCRAWSKKLETRVDMYPADLCEASTKVTGDYHIFRSTGKFSPTEVITVSSRTYTNSHLYTNKTSRHSISQPPIP